jgi:hypothetical protein
MYAAPIVKKEETSCKISIKFFETALIFVNFLINAFKAQRVEKLSGRL